MPTSLKRSVLVNLRSVRASLIDAEESLRLGAADDSDRHDMTPAEIAEASTLLSGIRARIALEIFSLEQPPVAPVKASA